MNIPVRIGMDTSKSVFQLHGVDESEVVVVRRQFRRAEMIRYFERLAPVLVAIEPCGSSHHWARLLGSFGHEVKLIPPQYVKAYVKRGKNDAADAEALCEHRARQGESTLRRQQGPDFHVEGRRRRCPARRDGPPMPIRC